MEVIDIVCSALIGVFGILTLHRLVYTILGVFCDAKRYPETKENKKYALVIAARDEEAVIGNLIDSIRAQDYPADKLTVFVVADNCSDKTAAISRQKGAVVYERFESDPQKKRKGFAMQFLFEQIKADAGIDSFDGYFVFDADNLLAPDFVTRMNEAFCTGVKAVTSYRNTKNFETNVISAAYGVHYYHISMATHRPRSCMNVGTHLTGTGFLLASELLADGWVWTTFTEDDQISLELAAAGIKTAYCEAAQIFDEQPTDMKTVWRQRVRWAKGRLQNFFGKSGKTFKSIFTRRSWTSYDIFTHFLPYGLFKFFVEMIYPACSLIYGIFNPETYDPGPMLFNVFAALGVQYVYFMASGILTCVRERRHIRCPLPRLMLYIFLFPWFDMLSVPVYVAAIFTKVEWRHIVHDDSRKIGDIMNTQTLLTEVKAKAAPETKAKLPVAAGAAGDTLADRSKTLPKN